MGIKFKGLKDIQHSWTLEHEVLKDETEVTITTRLFAATFPDFDPKGNEELSESFN